MPPLTHRTGRVNWDFVAADPFRTHLYSPFNLPVTSPGLKAALKHLWRCFITQSSHSRQAVVACSHLVRCHECDTPDDVDRSVLSLISCVIILMALKRNRNSACVTVVDAEPPNVLLDYIHWMMGHVTVLMLKNALVNINRPGWQDKFAFMPEEEKTSISLT